MTEGRGTRRGNGNLADKAFGKQETSSLKKGDETKGLKGGQKTRRETKDKRQRWACRLQGNREVEKKSSEASRTSERPDRDQGGEWDRELRWKEGSFKKK